MNAVPTRLRKASAAALTTMLVGIGAMISGIAGAGPAHADSFMTPAFCQTSAPAGFCLDADDQTVTMEAAGDPDEDFVAQHIGACGGAVTGACPFNESAFDSRYLGMPIVQLYDQSANECVATAPEGTAVLGTCNSVTSGSGGVDGTWFVDDDGVMINTYWTEVDAAADGGSAACMGGSPQSGGAVSLAVQASAGCPSWTYGQSATADYAMSIANGVTEYNPGYAWAGGPLPYGWAGGHETVPGPSPAICAAAGGDPDCDNNGQVSVDCSGFSRWVYALAYGYDILGPGSVSNTAYQMGKLRKVASGAEAPGDLVFFEPTGDPATPGYSEHVGVYIGDNEMINAPYTGVNVRADQVTGSSTTQGLSVMGYYRVA